MSRIIKNFKIREWLFIAVTLFLTYTQVWLDLKIPDYMSEVTILVQTDGSTMAEILNAGGWMLLCSIGSLILTICISFFAAQMATTVAMRMRAEVYNKTISFSMADMTDFTTGSLITRTTNDITQIQLFMAMGYTAFLRAPIMCIMAITKILGKNVTFSMVTAAAVCILLVTVTILLSLTIPKSQKLQKLIDNLNTVVREHLTGVRVVRAYNAEGYQEDKFEKANEEVTATNTFVNRTMAFMHPFMSNLMTGITLAIYWVGAFLINDAVGYDKLTIFSDMIVFSSYAMMIVMSFMMLTITFVMLPRVIVALGRVNEVVNFENVIVDGKVTESKEVSPVAVEFKHVTFSYGDSEEAVLEDISFKINKGETAAFIGSTGSGKSTIVRLILRFHEVTSGEILVDGINVKDYTQHALREKLGLVSQSAILFNGDITSNIAFGIEENISEEQLNKAVEIAQAKDFIDGIGLHGRVSQSGLNLSGGQKQRVSIARALYKKSEVYIFDDCFSALDYRTDKMLRAKLREETEGATKLMVAQRISTVKDADQIIVLDGGKVAGIGTHRTLLDTNAIYREIAESQLSKEELNYA
ncbi:MAG: ABC transporter ATP-binding protein [Eubacteriales bacterium]